MDASDDYCELCELPRSQCVHGQPPPIPTVPKPRTPRAPRKPPKRPTTRKIAPASPHEPPTLRWTPPESFKPLIITALERAGGELEADDLFPELEVLAQSQLRPADSERTPAGELRWQLAARRARVALIDEGLMTKAGPGVWRLSGEPSSDVTHPGR